MNIMTKNTFIQSKTPVGKLLQLNFGTDGLTSGNLGITIETPVNEDRLPTPASLFETKSCPTLDMKKAY